MLELEVQGTRRPRRLLAWALLSGLVAFLLFGLSVMAPASAAPSTGEQRAPSQSGQAAPQAAGAGSVTVTPSPLPTCGPDSNYTIAQSTGAIVPGTALAPGSQCDECVTTIPLPFTYYLYGQPFTSVIAGENGTLGFAANANSFGNFCLPRLSFDYAILPHWDDLITSANISPTLGIYASVTGAAPERIFNIEWRACRYGISGCGGFVNFEVRFYEGRAQFDIVYGETANAGNSATVGVQRGTGAASTQFACNTAGSVTPGLMLTFTQPPCGTLTPTNTRTPTQPVTRTPTPTITTAASATNSPTVGITATGTPCAMSFSDVNPSDYFYVLVRYLYCAGVISGYFDGTFRPYNTTTRGQMTKIVVLAFGYPIFIPPVPTFTDVPTTHTFYEYVETAAYEGIVSGYSDGSFRPQNDVTRGQLSKIVVVAAGWPLINPPIPSFSDVLPGSAFYQYIETAFCHFVISGYADGTFRPGNNATRGQIAKIVYEALISYIECDGTPQPIITRITYTPTRTHTPTRTSTPTRTHTPTHTPTPVPTCGPSSNYSVATATGTPEPGGTRISPDACDDCFLRVEPLPFPYALYGVPYTSIDISANGNIRFVSTTATPVPDRRHSCLPTLGASLNNNAIFAHWDDLDVSVAACDGCGIYASTSGVAPNRIYNIEWRACRKSQTGCEGGVEFEVRLHEGQARFDIVYGEVADAGSNAVVGVHRVANNAFTEFSCDTANSLQPNLSLIFQQVQCASPGQ